VAQQWGEQGGQSPGPSSARANEFLVKLKKIFSRYRELGHLNIKHYLCCMGVLCTWVKLLTDLQILGCKLYKNALGDRAPLPNHYIIIIIRLLRIKAAQKYTSKHKTFK